MISNALLKLVECRQWNQSSSLISLTMTNEKKPRENNCNCNFTLKKNEIYSD